MIVISIEKGDVAISKTGEPSLLDIAQQQAGVGGPGLYAQAMSAYIAWLAGRWDGLKAELRAEHESLMHFARRNFPSSQARLIDYFPTLTLGLRQFLKFAVSVGALTPAEYDELALVQYPAVIAEVLRQQGLRVSVASPINRVSEALAALSLQRQVYLAPRLGNAIAPPRPALRRA